MKLRCQLKGIKCPRYEHHGIFHPDDKTVKRLLPDVNWCANCIAGASPQRSDIQEDLQQIGVIVLIEKGPRFNPTHRSGASFSTFIRPRICGTLMDAKNRELTHSNRELCSFDGARDLSKDPDAEVQQDIGWLQEVPDPHAEFTDELVRNISFAATLPKLLKTLTPREREVFACLRKDQQNCEIAEVLNLSESRVSQLVTQVTQKLTSAAQRLGLVE